MTVPEVTMGDFAALCRRRDYPVDYLVELFAGQFGGAGMAQETTRQFFERVFQGRFAANVIPYRCLIAFYEKELGYYQDATGRERRCACGCGQRIFGRRKWASNACRQRGHRHRVGDLQNLPKKAA